MIQLFSTIMYYCCSCIYHDKQEPALSSQPYGELETQPHIEKIIHVDD